MAHSRRIFAPFRLGARLVLPMVLAGALVVTAASDARAQSLNGPLQSVTLAEGDTLRDIVERHLSDPDLWPVVLELSGIEALDKIGPGTVLKMPVEQVAVTDAALGQALSAIQTATAEGARLFAPVQIGTAIENRDTAVVERGFGRWAGTVSLAEAARRLALEALAVTLAQRDRAAEALVTDVQGTVEGRTPQAARWSPREREAVLVEFERVRTLSDSTAQITFRDLSRLRLNPNSNATIQTMRTDPLTGGEMTKVNLVSGDFYALLNQISDRTSFEIAVDGLETRTESSDFWIKNDAAGASFANYDQAALVIGSGTDALSLGQNQGAVIGNDGRMQVAQVLGRGELASPPDGARVYQNRVPLGWQPDADAQAYWIEIAADPGFNVMKVSQSGLAEPGFTSPALGAGVYHWRIAALDAFGLPGPWSVSRAFEVVDDTTPPFLVIASPASGALLDTPALEVSGETEPGAVLTVDGTPVPVAPDGRFALALQARPGPNSMVLRSTDAAGNRTERVLEVIYRPAEEAAITPDPALPRDEQGRFLTAGESLSFAAATEAAPGAALRVRDSAGGEVLQARVEADGRISMTLPAAPQPTGYLIEVLSPLGTVEGALSLEVLRDDEAPELMFELPPPQATSRPVLILAGTVPDAVELRLDGRALDLQDGAFRVELALSPGPNQVEFRATDRVGNVRLQPVRVVYDTTPPQVIEARAEQPNGPGGAVELRARALDDSGLRAVARYEITRDGVPESGLMRCEAAQGLCRASLPPQPGAVALVSVTLEDYAGNRVRVGPVEAN